MSPFLSAYFARTGWQQPVQVDIDTLRALPPGLDVESVLASTPQLRDPLREY